MLNICICQLIKDEQRYIEEWIEYYINLGVSKFILFEDWNSSSHKDILSKYGDKIILYELLNVLNNDEKKIIKDHSKLRQIAVWNCFYRLHKNDFDYCLFIDPDEYLHCSKNEFINELEYFINNTNAKFIRYKWQCITASGHIKDPYPNQKYSVINTYKEHYQNKLSELNNNFKCLIFLKRINNQNDFNPIPHGPYEYDWVHYSPIPIYHYLTKSWEEYKWRLFEKGEQTSLEFSRKIESFFEINQDLLQYKEKLLNECKNLHYKYNDYNIKILNICICQIIHNEHRYIEEWIDYYLNLGISKFILFEDIYSQSHKNILSKYGDNVILIKLTDIIKDNKLICNNIRHQHIIFKFFLEQYANKYDGVLFIDPDEYIQCNKNEFWDEINNIYTNTNNIVISYIWEIATASGHIKDPGNGKKYSLIDTYNDIKYIDKFNNRKTLFFINKCKDLCIDEYKIPHGPYWRPENDIYISKFSLRHFLTKSWEEYKYKLFVTGVQVNDKYSRKIEDFFEINDDLKLYKEQLLNECKELKYKYNDINVNNNFVTTY